MGAAIDFLQLERTIILTKGEAEHLALFLWSLVESLVLISIPLYFIHIDARL
jgi:hypothetical protein